MFSEQFGTPLDMSQEGVKAYSSTLSLETLSGARVVSLYTVAIGCITIDMFSEQFVSIIFGTIRTSGSSSESLH